MNALELVFVVVVVFLVVISSTRESRSINHFNRQSTGTLRGIAMIGIIFHHIGNSLGLSVTILVPTGYLCTGLFFFISGYGNELSLLNDKPSIKWLWSKLKKIYIPYFISYVIYFFVLFIAYRQLFPSIHDIIVDLLTVSEPNQVSWFPKVILISFVVHYFSNKVQKFDYLIVVLASLLYILVMHHINYPTYWYNSVLCYSFGIIVAKCELSNKNRIAKIAYLPICFGILTSLFLLELKLNSRYIQVLVALAFVALCYLYTACFPMKNMLLEWIGQKSFEFYLFHIVCLQAFSLLIGINNFLYSLCVFAGSFILVFVYSKIKTIIIHRKGPDRRMPLN